MKNFRINEFVCRCGCQMPVEVQANIEALVNNVLDPVREAYGKPIYVNSGYRCPKHNEAVGGVPRSQHMLGQAADISLRLTHSTGSGQAYGLQDELMKLARIILLQGRFDQLIIYPTFLHVSYRRSGVNRHKVLRKTATGYAVVPHTEAI